MRGQQRDKAPPDLGRDRTNDGSKAEMWFQQKHGHPPLEFRERKGRTTADEDDFLHGKQEADISVSGELNILNKVGDKIICLEGGSDV